MLAAKRLNGEVIGNELSVPYMTLTRNAERRKHRRHDLEGQDLPVFMNTAAEPLGTLMDLSSGGMKFKTSALTTIKANARLSIRLTLPSFCGIRAFVDRATESPATEWAGVMSVTRVEQQSDGTYTVAGRLLDMSDAERGLLGLYLSTQPLAA